MQDPYRILQVTYSLKAAGIETLVTNIYRLIDKKKYQFDFVSYYADSDIEHYEDRVRSLGANIYKLGFRKRRSLILNLIIRKRLYRCIKDNHYKSVHIHGSSGMAILEAVIAKMAGAEKIIIHAHNSNAPRTMMGRIYKVVTKVVKPFWKYFCTEYLACSREAAEWMFSAKLSKKVIIISNGIIPDDFFKDIARGQYWRSKFHIPKDAFLVGHVASFTYAKNQHFSVKIAKELVKLKKNSFFVFVGDGPEKDSVQREVKVLKIEDDCLFAGISSDVAEWMNACDVLILPSLYEGLPLVCIEAQYSQTPILVSANITKEVKISNYLYMEDLNQKECVWAEKILEIGHLGIEPEFYTDRFDLDSTVKVLEKIYDID